MTQFSGICNWGEVSSWWCVGPTGSSRPNADADIIWCDSFFPTTYTTTGCSLCILDIPRIYLIISYGKNSAAGGMLVQMCLKSLQESGLDGSMLHEFCSWAVATDLSGCIQAKFLYHIPPSRVLRVCDWLPFIIDHTMHRQPSMRSLEIQIYHDQVWCIDDLI